MEASSKKIQTKTKPTKNENPENLMDLKSKNLLIQKIRYAYVIHIVILVCDTKKNCRKKTPNNKRTYRPEKSKTAT